MGRLAQLAGGAIVLLALLDIFLTVLCARSGITIISERVGRTTWAVCRAVAHAAPRLRRAILCYAGPVILLLIVGVWIVLLLLGFGLIVWPALGTSVVSTRSETPRDFLTAIAFVGDRFQRSATPSSCRTRVCSGCFP